jgi:peptidoglycan hydrolase-like protein with peptidoglycan-binding domain
MRMTCHPYKSMILEAQPPVEATEDAHSGYEEDFDGGIYDYGYSAALQKLQANPEHAKEVAQWDALMSTPYIPVIHSYEEPTAAELPIGADATTLIAQGDTQTTSESTHPGNVDSHTSTTQHDEHGEHHAKHEESSHQPKAAPELEAIGVGGVTLSEGHQGAAVGEIQRLLELDVDGIFSADLAAQIAKFQEDEGIQATGVVDQLTLQLLREVEAERLRANQPTASKDKPRTFNLDVEQKQGFPQTQSVPETANEAPVEKPQQENQDNLLQQAARIINEGETGFLEGYATTTVAPLDPESTKAFERLHNNLPFNAGKALGDAVAGAQGVLGIVEGLLTIEGGADEIGVGLVGDSALVTTLGVGTVVAGVGMIGQGANALQRALDHFGKDVQNLVNPIDGGGGGDSKKSDKLSPGAQEAKDRGWPDPPEGYEWYKRKKGEAGESGEGVEGGESIEGVEAGEEGTKDVLDLRRKPGKQYLAERQYNPKTREFVLREKTPDFKARKTGEDIEIDVSTSKLFGEQLTIRSENMAERDRLEALEETLKKKNEKLSPEDELKLKEANQKIQDSSEAMGAIGGRHFMEKNYPHYERIEVPNTSGGAKQDRFDSIYKDPGPPPEYIIVEEKGGDGSFSTRQVGDNGELNAQQCTPEYNKSIIGEMKRRGEPEANGLRKALKEGRLRTFKSQTPIQNKSGQLKVEKLKVSEYDMEKSIRVDKTIKPTNPQIPSQ